MKEVIKYNIEEMGSLIFSLAYFHTDPLLSEFRVDNNIINANLGRASIKGTEKLTLRDNALTFEFRDDFKFNGNLYSFYLRQGDMLFMKLTHEYKELSFYLPRRLENSSIIHYEIPTSIVEFFSPTFLQELIHNEIKVFVEQYDMIIEREETLLFS